MNILLFGMFYSVPILIFLIFLYNQLLYIIHDYLSCSNGAYDLLYYELVQEEQSKEFNILSFCLFPLYIVFFIVLHIAKKMEKKQQEEI